MIRIVIRKNEMNRGVKRRKERSKEEKRRVKKRKRRKEKRESKSIIRGKLVCRGK